MLEAGSGEKMRKAGRTKGRPTASAFKQAAKAAKSK
tara:strand:- start:464 stop:571 length:108 start_codon:yes stop_codon:yes gene_type:complete